MLDEWIFTDDIGITGCGLEQWKGCDWRERVADPEDAERAEEGLGEWLAGVNSLHSYDLVENTCLKPHTRFRHDTNEAAKFWVP